MLCKCKTSRHVETIGSWDGCPLEGGHTQFIVQRCKECGGTCGFPQSNFDMALAKGTSETKKKLAEIIDENESGVENDRAKPWRCSGCGNLSKTPVCPWCGQTEDRPAV